MRLTTLAAAALLAAVALPAAAHHSFSAEFVGFQAKDGSLRASSRNLVFPDGRKMDLGGSGSAAQDPKK
jgi:hypothetical protein